MKIKIEHDVDDGTCVYIDDQLCIVGGDVVCIDPKIVITKVDG